MSGNSKSKTLIFMALKYRQMIEISLIQEEKHFFQIIDRIPYPTILSIFGNVGLILAFTFIGPLPYIPYRITLPLAEVCAVLLGYFNGFIFISTLIRVQKAAIEEGYSKDSQTSYFISGNLSTFWMVCDLYECANR